MRELKSSIFYITQRGHELAVRIKSLISGSEIIRYSSGRMRTAWHDSSAIVCIMAAGIVVRTIAPLIEDKKTDPAVVVIDEKGEFIISLLSGHLGGANELARKIAGHIGGHAVITTASDVQSKTALDLWAKEKKLYVEDYEALKKLSMKILNGKRIKLFTECNVVELSEDMEMVDAPAGADIIVSERIIESNAAFLRPGNLFAGIGCNRGTSSGEIIELMERVFEENNLSLRSLRELSTIDIKKDENGLTECAADMKIGIRYYSADTLNAISDEMGMELSSAVLSATGAKAVAEPAAIAAARDYSDSYELLIPKIKRGNATLAIARAEYTL